MIQIADALFGAASDPRAVTMDVIAAAAGVGKGTLFRAFGDRDGLLEALSDNRFGSLRRAVDQGGGPLARPVPVAERIVGLLDALLTFKLDNRALMRARENTSGGNLQSPRYRWTHDLLQGLLSEALPGSSGRSASYTAHALLSALQVDLLDELLAAGHTVDDIRREQAAHVRATLERHAGQPRGSAD